MTTATRPDPRASLPAALLALAPVGGKRRAVKVVEHPAFRPYRGGLALDAPFTVIRVPVVSLNRAPTTATRVCGGTIPTIAITTQEAA